MVHPYKENNRKIETVQLYQERACPNNKRHFIVASVGLTKTLTETSRECQNHKPQPNSGTKRIKKTKLNACKINKQMQEKHIDPLSLFHKRGDHNAKRTGLKTKTRTQRNCMQGKTQHVTLRSKNRKATQNDNNNNKKTQKKNTGTTV